MFTGHWIRSFSLLGMMLGLPTLAACGANPSPGELATAPTGKVVSALTAPNLALGKPATQSSTAYGADASRAVDGNTDGNFFNNSVTHTADSGWWQVDLQSVQGIGNVVLWNRTDCCSERLQNFSLLVSNNGTDWKSFPYPGKAGPQVSFPVNGPARYVKVQANSGIYPLSLAEVQVFAATNLALGRTATQSSTAYGADASRAVDGNTDGNFANNSVTHTADSGWWQVDLGSAQRVGNVVLWNRTDCCSERLQNFALLVSPNGTDWTSFPNPGTAGPQVSFAVNGLFRYVKVQANSGTYPLSLAEVQVLPMTAYGRGVGTVPSSGCGAGQDMDGGLCYPKCASGYHGVGPVCWPDATSYGRGAGTVPKSCGAGQDMDGGLCYPSCASGYHGVGPVCWQLCPDGYTDTGAFCERYAQTIDSNHGSCPWYDVCGLTFAKGCSSCPPGYNNTGCTCTIPDDTFAKKSSGRGVGTPPTTCGAGQDLDGGLCYSQCASGFHGVGPVCWPNATSYGRGVGSIPTSSCAAGHDLDAGLCYPSCDGGYHGMGPFCYSDALKGQEVIGSVCDALYLPAAAQLAISSGKALTFGLGAGIAAGGAAGVETGVAYGPGGEYGCYISTCEGVVTAVSISAWASVGAWNSFNSVSGNSVVVAGGLSTDLVDGLPVGVGAAVGLVSTDGGHPLPIGITASASLGAGLSAFVVLSAEACQTAVTKVR